MGTAGAGRAPDMIDNAKSYSESDMCRAGTAEGSLRTQTEVDGPRENHVASKRGAEAVIVTGRLAAAARAGGRVAHARAGLAQAAQEVS